ncbi:fatty acid desaturase family protein [Hoeflea sp.]|uniref:fatty acid desaturase family protein n=1 Tax=Hoeflea sp. TaxID=1940281 RepID=UPI003A9556D7
MDHRDFLASLSPEQRRQLTRKSDLRGLMHLALHFGLIGITAALIVARVPFWPVLMLIQGILLVFLFTLLHEASHETPFRSRWLNTAAAHISGLVILLPPRWFRYFHFAHHRHTQIPGKDPELAEPKPEGWADYIQHVSGLPVWISHLRTLVGNATGRCEDDFVPAGKRTAMRDEARTMLAAYGVLLAGSIAFRSPVLVFVWLLPMLIGQPFLRLYLLAEHGRCAHVANMLENSRTTFTNAAVRAVAWNMPYHAEHHAYPTVPFYKLPDLHRLTAEHLVVTEQGYARFHARYAPHIDGADGTAERG